MSLLEKMKKAGSIKSAEVLSESSYFMARDIIPTDLPILNMAFSGSINGGLVPGLTILAGQSKSFKTLLGLYCMKAYMNKYPDSVCLFYDSEFGITPSYLEQNGIDIDRVIHIPVEHVEQLKFDIVKRLDEVKRGDHVFIMVDSLGNLASKKEVEDANDEKSVTDMSRAKAIRSFLRIITPHLTMKDLPCIIVNHVYQTMELYSKTVIPGGTAVTYSANQIFIITKAQEKDGNELAGFEFTINIEKSRFVKEKSKFKFKVLWDTGIQKYSGLFDIAFKGEFIKEVSKGWYSIGQSDKKLRRSDIENDTEFLDSLLEDDAFKEYIEKEYKL